MDSNDSAVCVHVPGDQEGLFKLALQLRNFFNSVSYNTATGYVLLVYLTNI
jgi:membrane-bound lytic murein transglycosylase B